MGRKGAAAARVPRIMYFAAREIPFGPKCMPLCGDLCIITISASLNAAMAKIAGGSKSSPRAGDGTVGKPVHEALAG
jgi:hypothetical protein